MFPLCFRCLENISGMVCNQFQIECLAAYRCHVFMNLTVKACVRIQLDHAACPEIIIMNKIFVIIISLDIIDATVFSVLSALEKLNQCLGIFKPFIIVDVQKPFSVCCFHSHITCCCKIIAPCKRNNLIRVLCELRPKFRRTSRINQDQFRIEVFQNRDKGIQTANGSVSSAYQH